MFNTSIYEEAASFRYQYDLVSKLNFIRYGGTEEELRAANIIKTDIEVKERIKEVYKWLLEIT